MNVKLDFAEVQIVGERENQEDYCRFYGDNGNLMAVLADGMGGHASGEIAARLAVETFLQSVTGEGLPWSNYFLIGLNEANQAIAQHINDNPADEGMGCTLVGVELDGRTIRWTSVGDSRLFHFSHGKMRRINADHSMADRLDLMVRSGELSEEEASNSPSRHLLLSAVTGGHISRVDFSAKGHDTSNGDIVVLASDGIDTLGMTELEQLLATYGKWSAVDIGRAIISAVAKHGRPKQDNTTIMVIRINPGYL